MTRTMQTRFSAQDGSTRGNCFEACLASLLDLSIEAVPQFNEMPAGTWHRPFYDFIHSQGLEFLGTGRPGSHNLADFEGVDGFVIVSGDSPRPWVKDGHAVIYKNGVAFHDPHPSAAFLKEVKSWFLLKRAEVPAAGTSRAGNFQPLEAAR